MVTKSIERTNTKRFDYKDEAGWGREIAHAIRNIMRDRSLREMLGDRSEDFVSVLFCEIL